MSIPYLVRKKVSVIGGNKKVRWYAVQKKLQERGGKTEEDVARIVAERAGFREGEVQGILTEVSSVAEMQLKQPFLWKPPVQMQSVLTALSDQISLYLSFETSRRMYQFRLLPNQTQVCRSSTTAAMQSTACMLRTSPAT